LAVAVAEGSGSIISPSAAYKNLVPPDLSKISFSISVSDKNETLFFIYMEPIAFGISFGK